MNVITLLRHYIALTKPTIVLTFALTGLTAMVLEGSLLKDFSKFFLVLLAIIFTAASANGFNQYLERDLDARMERTRRRRPLPQSKISPNNAFIFSLILGILSFYLLLRWTNFLSVALALGTILFYVFVYTLWLKPRTPYNIVIGGAAGATAPLIGWAAATGEISWLAAWMFLIIFLWTPPHFWALALNVKDQYAKVGIPMLPVVKGEARTRQEIWRYSLILIPMSLLPFWASTPFSILYSFGALLLNGIWLYLAWRVYKSFTVRVGYQFFGYSIVYLVGLFLLMMF